MIVTSLAIASVKPAGEQVTTVMEEQANHFDVAILYKAISDNNRAAVKTFLDEHPSALTAKITSVDQTALHVAAFHGHVGILEELVRLASAQSLEISDFDGFTPLATAAVYNEDTRVAECIVNKSRNALGIPIKDQISLPVTLALVNGHKEMGRYLYSVTPLEVLKPSAKDTKGPMLLHWCFIAGELDIVLHLLQRCQELLFAKDSTGWTPIMGIAAMPFAFSNGSQLVFWKQWIYNYINIQSTTSTNSVRVNIQQQGESKRVKGLGLVGRFISNANHLFGIREIYEMKLVHAQAAQILSLLCENVSFLGSNMKEEKNQVANALFRAAREGNVEFVVKVSKANPLFIHLVSGDLFWNTFFYAVEYRQAKVFSLIRGLRFKDNLVSWMDLSGNSMLHVAGNLAPSSKLIRISGPAFQMQTELQWFKEVESLVPSGFRVHQNHNGKKPDDIFKESHKDLRKEGEKWMKETASSCSVVGALVVTIMFAAAFTVPGGNNQESGYPIFLDKKKKSFMLFVISDALSLFSSTTSVLIFLGILTSRYAEEDFLKSLPTKLIIGLSALFLSIATMMIAFSATILIMLQHKSHSWALLPVIMLASVPVTLFVLLQFPLLVQMVSSTYGPGIFKKNVKPWL